LNKIGFDWGGSTGDTWMTFYNELVQYKREFGNCKVPSNYKSNPPLERWVAGQRSSMKSKSLSEDRIKKLNRLGFIWDAFKGR
jgi:hypothetical protein